MPDFALPGDFDNDCDINGVVLTSVVRMDMEFLVSGSGGSGFWLDDNNERTEVQEAEGFELTVGINNDEVAELFSTQFNLWVEEKTPLHIVMCQTKYTSIIDHEGGTILPLPRT